MKLFKKETRIENQKWNLIITVNSRMEAIKSKIQKIVQTNSTVFIFDKTGTGKEVVAQSIHNLSEDMEHLLFP